MRVSLEHINPRIHTLGTYRASLQDDRLTITIVETPPHVAYENTPTYVSTRWDSYAYVA